MKKRVILVSILFMLILLPIMSASSAENEIKKVTHYAEDFETGNIDYIQLLVQLSSVRENLNEILGATGKEFGGVVKKSQVQSILGEPQEETKWVWVEGQNQEKKLDDYLPVWRKIVFDGKKLRITLSAHPSLINKCAIRFERALEEFRIDYYEENDIDFESLPKEEKTAIIERLKEEKMSGEDCEDYLIYRLHFERV